MKKRKVVASERQEKLFDVGPAGPVNPLVRRPQHPVWTENKARLIELYLRLFVLITKHGVYIDAFAGPQEPDKPDTWSAKLVLDSEPRWFRKFFLFDVEPDQVRRLEELRDAQPPKRKKDPKRTIKVIPGDVNKKIHSILNPETIRDREATFCLLDQRTFECEWSTVKALAEFKPAGQNKIELFYFLPNSWLDRAFSGLKDESKSRRWWGGNDWKRLEELKNNARADVFVERFKRDLGYKSAMAWPIYAKKNGGRIMYYMIHATDHPEAPDLMGRAYEKAVRVRTKAQFRQLALKLGLTLPGDA